MYENMRVAWKRIATWLLSALILIIFLFYIPTPYVAYEPGITTGADTLVKASRPSEASQGIFMLTTVKMSFAHYATVARSFVSSSIELYNRRDVLQGATKEQYAERASMMMLDSQFSAIEAAYNAASVPYKIVYGSELEAGKDSGERQLVPDNPDQKLMMGTSSIGGPSAGLILALQAYDELTEGEDLTSGYRIAGTGTITSGGEIGAVGGIAQKVTAACKSGAQIFLAPTNNAAAAEQQACKLNPKLRVIPVRTLSEAIAQLKRLPAIPQS